MIAQAVKMIADERCSQCGTPAWWAYNTDSSIDFELEDHTCYACAKRETAEEGKDREKGTIKIVHTVPVRYKDGTEETLPSRSDFYTALAKRAEALQALSNEVTEPIE